jgi:hypothetical protein
MIKIKPIKIELKPRVNSANGQIVFNLNKKELSKDIRNKLPKLKSIKINSNNLKFEDEFEEKWI